MEEILLENQFGNDTHNTINKKIIVLRRLSKAELGKKKYPRRTTVTILISLVLVFAALEIGSRVWPTT